MYKNMYKPDFLIIPYSLLEDDGLNHTTRVVYGVIYWFFRMQAAECRASNATIAEYAKTTASTVANALVALEKSGHIKRVFSDAKKRTRAKIIPMRIFGVSSISEGVSPIGYTEVSPRSEQKNNINTKNNTCDPSKEGRAEEFVFKNQLDKLAADSTRPDGQLVAKYWSMQKMAFPTKEEYNKQIRSHITQIKSMLKRGYTASEIAKCMNYCENSFPSWTLGAVAKYLSKSYGAKKALEK